MLHAVKEFESAHLVAQETGRVEALEGDCVTVRTTSGTGSAQRAVSCLVAPEVGDEVLLASMSDGRSFILAVLERKQGAPLQLEAEGDVTWRLRQGHFTVAAQRGIALSTAGEAGITAGALRVAAVEAGVHVDQLTYLGRLVHGQIDKMKLFAGAVETVFDRLLQRVKRSYRFVEETDLVQAEYLDYAAKMNVQLRGRNALVTAEQLVKLDGDQIHVG